MGYKERCNQKYINFTKQSYYNDSNNIAYWLSFFVFISFISQIVFLRLESGGHVIPIALCIVLLINESLVKNLLKGARPEKTCIEKTSYGMPSTHALIVWYIFFCFCFLGVYKRNFGFGCAFFTLVVALITSFARVKNNDHTTCQVLCGFLVGLVCSSFVIFYLYRQYPSLFAHRTILPDLTKPI